MGKATGKTFEKWLGEQPNGWALVHEEQIDVQRRNDADDGTECVFTVPEKRKENGEIRPERPVPFTIPDAIHGFPEPTGRNDFRRYALLVGGFLAQGGVIEDVTDPFHEDDEDA